MLRLDIDKNHHYEIIFSGGLGNQIFSAAVFFLLHHLSIKVSANLSYFDAAPLVAQPGMPGQVSSWAWELDKLGISKDSLLGNSCQGHHVTVQIPDGEWKMLAAIHALQQAQVLKEFRAVSLERVTKELSQRGLTLPSDFIAIHLRRGDYLNVASHIVPDHVLLPYAIRASRFSKNLVIVSDSPIPAEPWQSLRSHFDQLFQIDDPGMDVAQIHSLMASAKVLFTSNSQFSLSAAFFNPNVVFIPDRWYGQLHATLERLIVEQSPFFLFNS